MQYPDERNFANLKLNLKSLRIRLLPLPTSRPVASRRLILPLTNIPSSLLDFPPDVLQKHIIAHQCAVSVLTRGHVFELVPLPCASCLSLVKRAQSFVVEVEGIGVTSACSSELRRAFMDMGRN